MMTALNENRSSIAFPAMLRFKRFSAVTAMMAMTMPMTRQRTRLGRSVRATPAAVFRSWAALLVGFNRLPSLSLTLQFDKPGSGRVGPLLRTTDRLRFRRVRVADGRKSQAPGSRELPGIRLPDHLQAELNLPGRGGRLVQGRRQRTSVEVNDRVVLSKRVQESGRQEIRMVEKVEELGAELQVEGFRNAWDLRVLED